MFVCLTLLCTCDTPAHTCTFTKSDLPVPVDSVIVGDPRKKAECRRSSFEETRPAKLFDPGGVRMWTREEDNMARSDDEFVRSMFEKEMEEDPYLYFRLNMVIGRRSNGRFDAQLLRNLKAGSTTILKALKAGNTCAMLNT